MAQIRSKQIKDFLSTVNWADVTGSQIANASDIKSYVDAEVTAANGNNSAVSDALVAEIASTNSDFTRVEGDLASEVTRATGVEASLSSEIVTEKDRIDAILLASDADKDSFAEIVSLINAVDTVNDDALAVVITNLNNEIAATNSDITRLEGADSTEKLRAETAEGVLSTNLAAELVARANGDSVNATAISAEESRAILAEGSLETKFDGLHSTLSTEVVNEVASIDLRLGSVSGDLVSSVDSLEVALSAEIVATNSDVTALEGAISDEESRAIAAELSLTTRVSSEEATRLANDNTLQSNIDGVAADLSSYETSNDIALAAEKTRAEGIEAGLRTDVDSAQADIDAILLAADADKDSFAEIVTFINAVDLTNDNALAAVISNLNAEIAATNNDFVVVNASIDSLEALAGADMASVDTRVSDVEDALAAEIAATNTDVSDLNGALAQEILDRDAAILVEKNRAEAAELKIATDLSSYETSNDAALAQEILDRIADVDAEEARALAAEGVLQTNITNLETAHDGRLVALEATIIEDNEMAVESFPGAGFVYNVANAVQDDNKFLVSAFVNGHKVEVATVLANTVTLADPNYVIDAQDSVVITYQF